MTHAKVGCGLGLTLTTPILGCRVSAKLNLGSRDLSVRLLCNGCMTAHFSHILFSELGNENTKLCVTYKRMVWWRERKKPERECIVSVVSLCSKNISLLFFSLTLSEPPCPAQVLLVLFRELMSLPELHRLS